MKATSIAPSNIAFIKYWGKLDENLRLPVNSSISMNLSGLTTTTTVEFSDRHVEDTVVINEQIETGIKKERVTNHLDRVRKLAKINYYAKVVSKNNFPQSTGLSSSASGFAALTLAAAVSAGLKLKERELSILARQASGSACRSIPDGFVQWQKGNTSDTSFAYSLFPHNYWEIRDIVAVVSSKTKDVSSTEGQKLVSTSPFFQMRLKHIDGKIKKLKKYLREKNFLKFGKLAEAESLELHAIMITSNPALIYFLPETIEIIKLVQSWRKEGLMVFFSLNTGQDVHLITIEKYEKILAGKLKRIGAVKQIIINSPAKGSRLISNHLF